jgi:hypothetical protein
MAGTPGFFWVGRVHQGPLVAGKAGRATDVPSGLLRAVDAGRRASSVSSRLIGILAGALFASRLLAAEPATNQPAVTKF